MALEIVVVEEVWCGKFPWDDPQVIALMAEQGARLTRIDRKVESERAAALGVTRVSTVIMSRDGVELDRYTGTLYRSQALAWLRGLARGETFFEALRAEITSPEQVHERLDLANRLAGAKRYAEALAEYVALWQFVPEQPNPGWRGVRNSFLLVYLQELADAYPPARERFTALRDALEGNVAKLGDWFGLNFVVGDDARSLAWYDGGGRELAVTDPEVAWVARFSLRRVFEEAERWADHGAQLDAADAELAAARDASERVRPILGEASAERTLRGRLAMLLRSYEAAGRTADASAVRAAAPELELRAGD